MGRPRQISDTIILETARAAFLEHGPAISTVEIARLVGLSQATLFKRFGTKSVLMQRALMPPAEAPFIDILKRGPDERALRTQLLELAVAVGRYFDLIVPCLSVLRAAGVDGRECMKQYDVPPPVRAQRALASWLRSAADVGHLRAIDEEATAILFLGALQARALLKHLLGSQIAGIDDERFLNNLVDVITVGLAPRRASDEQENL